LGIFFILILIFARPSIDSPLHLYNPVKEKKVDQGSPRNIPTVAELYLELMKTVLTRYELGDTYKPLIEPQSRVGKIITPLLGHVPIYRRIPFDPISRENGWDTPENAETMIGLKRLDNLQYCIEQVISQSVPGDLIECGAWRGGACIFMRAVLKTYGDAGRKVWVADSFEGLPKPDKDKRREDAQLWQGGEMAVTLSQVKRNFDRFGLLDDQVCFLKGFFIDTLPDAPIKQLAVLRLDCDMYDSVTQSLEYLYDKVAIGGFVIIDDYGALPPARSAVDDYRKAHGIEDKVLKIDWTGVYWQKSR
jgi:hypothetical protein